MTYQERRRLELEYQRSYAALRRTVVMMFLALISALLLEVAAPGRSVAGVTIGIMSGR